MKKICLLGLSGSGKSCYLYAASHLLQVGIRTSVGTVSIVCSDTGRSSDLNNGIKDMDGICPVWPKGTDKIHTKYFPYELYVKGAKKLEFEVCDYRGGVFNETDDNAHDERLMLYEESNCVVVFIDAYTLLQAFRLKNEDEISKTFTRGDLLKRTYSDAISELNHLKVIANEARRNISQDTPILLVITKKDILLEDELKEATDKLKMHMDIFFSEETSNPVGITAISLGSNLGAGGETQDGQKKMLGQMHLSVSNNIHIPILFPLFIDMDLSLEEKELAKKIFNSNHIQLYVKGKPAVISF